MRPAAAWLSRHALLLAAALLGLTSAADIPAARATPREFHKGICYAHTWGLFGRQGYGSDTSAQTLDRLQRLGAEWLSLTPFGFMPSLDAETVRMPRMPGSESDARLVAEVKQAHARGMKVALKPHLWIRHGEWQGDLRWQDDAAYRRWFSAYADFMRHYAELAAREHFDLLVIGTELKSATRRDSASWRGLITELRRIYRGPLTYAANWDEAEQVGFWDALDYVGVNVYAPLTAHRGASLDELTQGWKRIAGGLEALARHSGRPVLITEIGYRATRDAALAPSAWPENDKEPHYDPKHQADCYRAAFAVLWGKPWLAGIYVWKWFTDSGDESGPTDFSPAGKEAEAVLRSYYQRPAGPTSTASTQGRRLPVRLHP